MGRNQGVRRMVSTKEHGHLLKIKYLWIISRSMVKVNGAILSKKQDLRDVERATGFVRMNYLRPNIKRGNISDDEDDLIIRLHKLQGNRRSVHALLFLSNVILFMDNDVGFFLKDLRAAKTINLKISGILRIPLDRSRVV